MKQFRTYSFRLYPTQQQQKRLHVLWQHALFVHGAFRNFQEKMPISKRDVKPLLNKLVQQYTSLEISPRGLLEQSATQSFDKQQGFSGLLYTSFEIKDSRLEIEGVGRVKLVQSRPLSRPYRVTLAQKEGKWTASFLISLTSQEKPVLKSVVGCDMGLKDFLTLSDGTRISYPSSWNEISEKLKEEQRKLSRKEKGSNTWKKQSQRVRKLYQKLMRVRHDFLHKISRNLVNRYDIICLEDLSLSSLQENKKIRSSLQDAAWATFVHYVQYKAGAEGKKVILADRFFPSTKRCSGCGAQRDMPLKERLYTCKNCGLSCDRDENAAKNLAWYAGQNVIERKGGLYEQNR